MADSFKLFTKLMTINIHLVYLLTETFKIKKLHTLSLLN